MHKRSGKTLEVAYIAQENVSEELFDYVANSGPFEEPFCKYLFK